MQGKYFKNLILLSVFLFTFVGFFANAQIRNTDVILDISPQYPGPNQSITAILGSHVVNLNKSNITWFVDGQKIISGIGKKSFSFTTGSLGSNTELSVNIDTVDGQNISKRMNITVADIDMLWEAYDAYTPPFYKGKALEPSQGQVKVVAMPNLVNQSGKVNINNLSYSWKKDGNPQQNSSGWGKNYFIFRNSYLDRNNVVEVKVSDITGGTNTSGKITLTPIKPKILFYKNDPILGIKWEKTLGDDFTINPSGEIIVAEPFFFSPKNINSDELSFNWSINGSKIETPSPKNILAIKPDGEQTGNSIIKLLVENTETLFQSLTKQIQVSF